MKETSACATIDTDFSTLSGDDFKLEKPCIKNILLRIKKYVFTFVKWIIVAGVSGLSGGLVGSVFHTSIEYATAFRETHPYIVWFLPIGGIVIAAVYKLFKLGHTGTNKIIDSVRSSEKVPFLLAPAIFISTVITHLFGGSAGREGAALQLGGTIGKYLSKLFRLGEKDVPIAVMCGMSAVFSALFGTPMTAAIFAIEVISIGIMHYAALIPCLVSSLAAYGVSVLLGSHPVSYQLAVIPELSWQIVLQSATIGAVSAIAGIIFCVLLHKGEFLLEKFIRNTFLRAAIGGLVIVLLGTLIGTQDYFGAGSQIIEKAICTGVARPEAFALKILFTMLTICSGYKGGEIVPTFFIGSTLGSSVSSFIGLNKGFGASLGLVSMFCAVVNCPIASIILSIELFGTSQIIPYVTSCAVSYMLSGYFGLYTSQKIVYSKLSAKYVNADVK